MVLSKCMRHLHYVPIYLVLYSGISYRAVDIESKVGSIKAVVIEPKVTCALFWDLPTQAANTVAKPAWAPTQATNRGKTGLNSGKAGLGTNAHL